MFDNISRQLGDVFSRLRSKGRLAEGDVEAALREVRLALLEADVNVAVVKTFLGRVKERAIGAEVTKSLTPGQQVIKIVHEELITTLGSEAPLARPAAPPLVILMAGLQGSGKTTTAAKLAKHLKSKGRRPLLVAADLQRPAAIDQLETLGKRIGVPVYRRSPVEGAQGRQGSDEAGQAGGPQRRHRRHRRADSRSTAIS